MPFGLYIAGVVATSLFHADVGCCISGACWFSV